MAIQLNYEILSQKVDRLAAQIQELQEMVRRFRPGAEEESQEACARFLELSDKVTASWQGPNVVEEIRMQRSRNT
jgi:hypothetical protein